MCYDSIKHMPKNKYGNGIFRRRIIAVFSFFMSVLLFGF